MEESDMCNVLSETNSKSVPAIKTEEIYNNLHKLAKSTPDIWAQLFTSISKLPQLISYVYNRILVFLNKLLCWLVVKMLEDINFIQENKIERLWTNIHGMSTEVIQVLFNHTQLIKNMNIHDVKDDYVNFIYVLKQCRKNDKHTVTQECDKLLKMSKMIRKYNLDKLWIKLKDSSVKSYSNIKQIDTLLIGLHDNSHSFEEFYNYFVANNVCDDMSNRVSDFSSKSLCDTISEFVS